MEFPAKRAAAWNRLDTPLTVITVRLDFSTH